MIDVNQYPLPEIEAVTRANRKIGLGVMGFAHMLIKLDIAYDSDRGGDVAEEVMAYIERESKIASLALAEERGELPEL